MIRFRPVTLKNRLYLLRLVEVELQELCRFGELIQTMKESFELRA